MVGTACYILHILTHLFPQTIPAKVGTIFIQIFIGDGIKLREGKWSIKLLKSTIGIQSQEVCGQNLCC